MPKFRLISIIATISLAHARQPVLEKKATEFDRVLTTSPAMFEKIKTAGNLADKIIPSDLAGTDWFEYGTPQLYGCCNSYKVERSTISLTLMVLLLPNTKYMEICNVLS